MKADETLKKQRPWLQKASPVSGEEKGMGSGDPQRQHLTGKEEEYVGEQLSSLRTSIELSLHEAETEMGTRLLRALHSHCLEPQNHSGGNDL